MGTALRILEENTPWSNRAELYIGIIKEAVREDVKESDFPLALWGYCAERRVRIHNLTAKFQVWYLRNRSNTRNDY
jgi:hypothetical protein